MASWRNWSGSVGCNPQAILYPQTLDEIIAAVRLCREGGRRLRVVGSGHSFTPVAATDEMMLSLEKFAGVEHADLTTGLVTVRAGTRIKDLGELLAAYGLAQENLGDIDVQSIAGAISTGTHGSGAGLGTIATQVAALTLVTADGTVLHCSEDENRDVFKAAQISLGSLGIIARVTLRCVPAYTLDYRWEKQSLSETLDSLERHKSENRNFEFFWIPYTDTVLAKFMNITDAAPRRFRWFRRFNEAVLENAVLWLLSETARLIPAASRHVARMMAALVSSGRDIAPSHQAYATVRAVKFQEMEYSIPTEHFADCLRAIDTCIRQERFKVHFPVECRFVKGDDIPLSPAYGRDSAYIAVHMYRGMPYERYFQAVESIIQGYGGRPHWGKLHTRGTDDLRVLYPLWDDFMTVRQRLDPDGFFLNDYAARLFGAARPE
ncbi:MAG: D-arabinono-1,4-lactone oxidase [Chloroflexota bacterium]